MPKTRNLALKVQELNRELMLAFRQTLPGRQFQSELMLGQIGLNVLVKRLAQDASLQERRRLKHELSHGIRIMERGIEALLKHAEKSTNQPITINKPFQQIQ